MDLARPGLGLLVCMCSRAKRIPSTCPARPLTQGREGGKGKQKQLGYGSRSGLNTHPLCIVPLVMQNINWQVSLISDGPRSRERREKWIYQHVCELHRFTLSCTMLRPLFRLEIAPQVPGRYEAGTSNSCLYWPILPGLDWV